MSGSTPIQAFLSSSQTRNQKLENELHTAVNSAIGSNAVTSYKKVAVIFVRFEHDDIGVVEPERELMETFRNYFRITYIKSVVIPRPGNPDFVLSQAILQLCDEKYAEENCLIILVFSGHGRVMSTEFQSVQATEHELCLK